MDGILMDTSEIRYCFNNDLHKWKPQLLAANGTAFCVCWKDSSMMGRLPHEPSLPYCVHLQKLEQVPKSTAGLAPACLPHCKIRAVVCRLSCGHQSSCMCPLFGKLAFAVLRSVWVPDRLGNLREMSSRCGKCVSQNIRMSCSDLQLYDGCVIILKDKFSEIRWY